MERIVLSEEMRRQILCVAYGGHLIKGHWVPNVALIAKKRKVTPRTVYNWLQATSQRGDEICRRLLRARQVKPELLYREQLAHSQVLVSLARVSAGFRRGRLVEFRRDGRLEPHSLLIVRMQHLPLCKPVVARSDIAGKYLKGYDQIYRIDVSNSFEAEDLRFRLLKEVGPGRVAVKEGTQFFLEGTPNTIINVKEKENG